jgi:hypothetical protein
MTQVRRSSFTKEKELAIPMGKHGNAGNKDVPTQTKST